MDWSIRKRVQARKRHCRMVQTFKCGQYTNPTSSRRRDLSRLLFLGVASPCLIKLIVMSFSTFSRANLLAGPREASTGSRTHLQCNYTFVIQSWYGSNSTSTASPQSRPTLHSCMINGPTQLECSTHGYRVNLSIVQHVSNVMLKRQEQRISDLCYVTW